LFYDFLTNATTVLQFKTQLSQNWIGYLSNVGDAFGLCLGFSITTLAELTWLSLRLIKELVIGYGLIRKMKTIWNSTVTSIHNLMINNE